VSPLRYKLGCYIQEDDILHSHRRENLKSYMYMPDSCLRQGYFFFLAIEGNSKAILSQVTRATEFVFFFFVGNRWW
jgi:hypothetical protein